ncbi:SAM-dependent methyltransferase [Methanosarcina thermophila MST-A1]|jgi:ubiquinone/menaquinone biosynthesis C-methylase UbiE|uniref:class I SAM-dependent methyltransferase n=1 Tax=Methanosarcina thermophila TaxID=2210 RepID=UPI0006D74B94|nr:class I SAM-dependent methyltransferase [Methanosarcina thermophila]ALK06322.1 MAG: methyltransferase [Methanosarcina sp. 795]NLU57400.1 methyltransferase domain-containing protein [Methanosarcina thermophila]GLI14739.1 SAM-dependent methyltransferase [Methanosarcina thermophila MST-A1]
MDTKKIIQSYWDYRSESYNNGVIENSKEGRNAWKAMLLKAVEGKKGLKVLDVGTGPGFLALLFAEMGNEVTAVDLSNNMLEKARRNALKRSLKIDFLQGDAENLQLPDAYFDVVVNKYLLWTLPDPRKALMEWRRVLKDGGKIIAIDGEWNQQSLSGRKKEENYMKIFRKQYEPIKKDLPLFSLKPEYLSKIFKDSGFGTVSITRMEDFFKFEKEKDSLFDKHDSSDPIYFIKAEK